MAGPFIERQLVANDFEETTWRVVELIGKDMMKQHKEVWEEFCTIIQVLYPYPIQVVETTGQV